MGADQKNIGLRIAHIGKECSSKELSSIIIYFSSRILPYKHQFGKNQPKAQPPKKGEKGKGKGKNKGKDDGKSGSER